MNIPSKTFLITGGSSGLGAACAQSLTAAGANVIIADIQEDEGVQLAGSLGDKALYVETDVTSEKSVSLAINQAQETFSPLHGLINCAGIAIARKVVSSVGLHDLDSFARVIQVNLVGSFNAIRLAAASMVQNEPDESGERGVIINTASVAAFEGQVGQAAYSASKGGVVAMTLPIARELAYHGIRVNTIAPGLFDTPMLAGLPEKARQSLAGQVPFPSRLGDPGEFGALALHIIQNQMINGETIRLDGAIRMAPR